MAKPRIFVSSTYYDLKHIRISMESFINEIGYESVLFENGDIPFDHHESLDESCYKELESCHIFVLLIGGRYGSATSDENVKLSKDELEKHYQHFNSITKKEYESAKERDIPIYIFVEKGVAAEYQTYKENRDNKSIKYAHVDSVNIFRLLDIIYTQKRNNLVKEFENVEDITQWLREQWAGLFTKFLMKKSNDAPIVSLEKQLANLNIVTETLKDYSSNIIQGLSPDNYTQIIKDIDNNEKHRSELNKFLRDGIIKHFVDTHKANPEQLYHAFIVSKDINEFANIARTTLKDSNESCGMLDNPSDIRDELYELRETLNLPKWIQKKKTHKESVK